MPRPKPLSEWLTGVERKGLPNAMTWKHGLMQKTPCFGAKDTEDMQRRGIFKT